jgi:tetrathionate reductase subunit A
MTSRRNILKAGAALGGTAAFAAGFSETGERMLHSIVSPAKALGVDGRSLKPEMRVDEKGALQPDPSQRVSYTMCMGCTTQCGVRVRIDTANETVVRVSGNPYSPLSTDPHLPMGASVRQSFISLSRFDEKGLAGRSTACGRGNAVLEQMNSPYRITTPLKRVGPRNSGEWRPIPFEQLVKEVVEGGDLFGEGPVKGLRELRSFDPIDPAQPELGPRVNKVAFLSSVDDGRMAFLARFAQQAYGTINLTGHGAYCGGSYRAGSGAVFGDTRTMPHAKPDLQNAEFVIFIGTQPAQSGNPFKRQSTLLAKARTTGKLDYVVVDPVLGHSDNLAVGERGRWIPIKPGTDAALAMAMIRWMIDEQRIDAKFLGQPNLKTAQAAGEAAWSNATHLVVVEPGHPRNGFFLRGSDLGQQVAEADRYKEADPFVVIDAASDAPVAHAAATGPAALFVERSIDVAGAPVKVASALSLLAANARARTIEEYAAICGVPAETIVGLAREFTAHGKKAAASAHGGTMAGNGFQSAFAIVMLNTLVGNLNVKGGSFVSGGGFNPYAGPRYRFDGFAGAVKPAGVPLSRNFPYEKTTEFKRKKEAGKPYPAEAPWFSTAGQLSTEWLPAALSGYPYGVDALVLWSSNPVYGIPGVRSIAEKTLGDPRKIPLVIAVDPFINESTAFADYIVPETAMYESWGFVAPWAGVPTKTMLTRWPVVEPRTAKTADGQTINGEMFLIAVAKALRLPGFGANAIAGADGRSYALDTPEDWWLRAAANIAFTGKAPVGDATDDDIALSGVSRLIPLIRSKLPEDEARKVAFLFTRGGRHQPAPEAWDQNGRTAWPFEKPLNVWNEAVGTAKDAMTGKRFSGAPQWAEPAFADGSRVATRYPETEWPLLLVSQKSVLQNSYSIAARRLRSLHPDNPVGINAGDAERIGVKSGDAIRISTPAGSVTGVALVRHGVKQGVLAVEHGFGHRELGARPHKIGDRLQPSDRGIAAGVSLNDIGLLDPTRKSAATFVDPIAGTSVRQGLPARLEKA